MPWKECNVIDERLRFLARFLDGEKMAPLCREFDISRKTGYKIFNRYKDIGLDGLSGYRELNADMTVQAIICFGVAAVSDRFIPIGMTFRLNYGIWWQDR